MRVNLNINASARIGETQARRSRPAPADKAQEDELSLSPDLSGVRAAQSESDVRPEKVARAREAIANSKYPPTEVIDQISRLLAIQETTAGKEV